MSWTICISILLIVSLPCQLAYRIERQAVTEALEIEPTEALEQEWPITTPPAFGGSPLGPQGVQAGPNVAGGQPAQAVGPSAPRAQPAGEVEVETPEVEVPVTNPPIPTTARQFAGGFFDPIFGFYGPTTQGAIGFQDFYYQTTAGSVIDQSIAIAPGRSGLTGPEPIVIGDILGVPNSPQQRGNVIDVTAARSQIGIGNQGQYFQAQPMGAPLSSTNSITRSRENVQPGSNIGAAQYLQINTGAGPQYGQGQISARSDGIAVDYQGSIQIPVQGTLQYLSNRQAIPQAAPPTPSYQQQVPVSNAGQMPNAVQTGVPSSGSVQKIPQSSGTGGRQSSGPIANQGQLVASSGTVALTQDQQSVEPVIQGEILSKNQGNPPPRNPTQAPVNVQTTVSTPNANVLNQNTQGNQVAPSSQISNQVSGSNQISQTNQASGTANSGATTESYQGQWVFQTSGTTSSGPGPIRGQWVFQTAFGTLNSGPAPITGQWVFEPEPGAVRNGTNPIRGQWVFKPDPVQSTANLATSGPGNGNVGQAPQQPTTATLPENTVPPQGTGTAQPTTVSELATEGNSQFVLGTSARRLSAFNGGGINQQPAPLAGSSGAQVQGHGSISVPRQITLNEVNLPSSVNQLGAVDILTVTTSPSFIVTTGAIPTTAAITTPPPVTEPIEIEPTEPLEIEPTPGPEVPPTPAATVPSTTIPGVVQPNNPASTNQTISPSGSVPQPGLNNAPLGQENVVAVQPSNVAVVEPVINTTSGQEVLNPSPSQAAIVPSSNSQSIVAASQASAANPPSILQTGRVWPQAGPIMPQP